ncbi:hypothetical protein P8452_04360 [Trifolium repens]|nr:hypothetical protein P8452_04360 [Trifolium repens]
MWFDFPSLANASVFVSLGSSINLQSQPLDAFVTFLEKSQPCKETTIHVLCKLPIIDHHVVFLLLTLGTISTCLLYALAAKCSSQAVLHECYKIRDHYTFDALLVSKPSISFSDTTSNSSSQKGTFRFTPIQSFFYRVSLCYRQRFGFVAIAYMQ